MTTTKTTQRIYVVNLDGLKSGLGNRLVKASSQAQAIRYVIKSAVTCRVPAQIELVEMMQHGAVIEDAAHE